MGQLLAGTLALFSNIRAPALVEAQNLLIKIPQRQMYERTYFFIIFVEILDQVGSEG